MSKISLEKREQIKQFAVRNTKLQAASRFNVSIGSVKNFCGPDKKIATKTIKEKVKDNQFFRHEDFAGI